MRIAAPAMRSRAARMAAIGMGSVKGVVCGMRGNLSERGRERQ